MRGCGPVFKWGPWGVWGQVMKINEKGQCPECRRKPLTYKRRRMLFCARCDREFDMDSGEQRENWAWKRGEAGEFVSARATRKSSSQSGLL